MWSTLCLIINHRGKKNSGPSAPASRVVSTFVASKLCYSGAQARFARQRSTMGKAFWVIYRCENFCYDVTYVRPFKLTSRTSAGTVTSRTSARTDCRGGGGEVGHSLGTGVFGQFSLAGNRVAALHPADLYLTARQI